MTVLANLRRARHAVEAHGLSGTARLAWTHARGGGAAVEPVPEDDAFDREHGVQTGGIVRLHDLSVAGENRRHGVRYQPSAPAEFRELIAAVGHRLPAGAVFVDLGCGKGRVLLLARELPVQRIVGVEFSAELADVASRNAAQAGGDGPPIEVVCSDAAAYALPEAPLVLYNYNSFGAPVLAQVLANLRASLDARPREVVLLMVNRAVDADVLLGAGLTLEQETPRGELWRA